MPHASPLLPRRIPSSPRFGIPMTDRFGLTVIPVSPDWVPARSPPQVVFEELDAPAPTQLLARNPTRRAILVPLGQVVAGGMADRALATTVPIPPGATAPVPVEPLSPRWWASGSMRTAGELSPALSALLILARAAPPGLRSVALTALWAASRQLGGDMTPPPREWVLLHGSRAHAIHLVGRRTELWLVRASLELPNLILDASLG